MISLKMLSTAAALALLVPMTVPTASLAEGAKIGRAGTTGGAAFRAAPATNFAAAPARSYAAGVPAARPSGGAAWTGGRTTWNGGGAWRGDRHDHGRGFIPGAVAGAVIGGALAAGPYAYYDGPGYYDQPAYYDDQYADDGAVAVVPAPIGDDSAAYCAQRYRSYDPASGTYLGFDGLRHPCP
jgi:BA14K-like protein